MITAQDLRSIALFAALPDNEAETLAARVADVRLREGDWLIHEGEQPSFFLLIDGSLEVRKVVHGTERRITEYHQGGYFGELPLLLGSPAIVSLRAMEPARVAQLDHGDFTQLFTSCSAFASELTRTMMQRVTRLQDLAAQAAPPGVTIVGHPYDIACHQLRDFLARNRIAFRWVDPTRPPASGEIAAPQPGDRFPVVILANRKRLVTPTLRELAIGLELQTAPGNSPYDLASIGAGPAGLAAAVYGASEGLKTILIEREAPGGQAGTSSRIENYLGFPTGLPGDELTARAVQQAQRSASAAALPVGRPPCSSPITGARSRCWCGPRRWRPACRTTSSSSSRRRATSRCARAAGSSVWRASAGSSRSSSSPGIRASSSPSL